MVEDLQRHIQTDNQWSTYESNVQAYRQMSIAAQSLYLAVGAILLSADTAIAFFVTMAMALLTTWYVFFPVIFARCAIADYHKFNMRERFDSRGNRVDTPSGQDFLLERAYANLLRGSKLRRAVAAALGSQGKPFRVLRQTRVKLDLVLPASFTLVWLIFGIDMLFFS